MAKVTTAIILDERRKTAKGTYPVKLRLTSKGQRRLFGIDKYLTKADFKKVKSTKPGDFKDLQLELNEQEAKANSVIKSMPVFSFDLFKKRFFDAVDYTDLFGALRHWVKKYNDQGRPGTASTFSNTLKSWEGFHKGDTLPLSSITPDLLAEYERYMLRQGKSITTVGFYLRNVRRIFNLAIKAKSLHKDFYPFGDKDDGLYSIPEPQNVKKALSKRDIEKIFKYKPLEGSPEHYYRDLWLFSYLANGMNLADIARLTYKDIGEDTIIFIRQKTAHRKKVKPVIVPLTPEVRGIIARWGNKPADPKSHVFKILPARATPAQELERVKAVTKLVNKYINRVASAVGIKDRVTSYSARHSFATVLKLSGVDIAYISEALNHSDMKVTDNYFKSFGWDQMAEAAKKLTDW